MRSTVPGVVAVLVTSVPGMSLTPFWGGGVGVDSYIETSIMSTRNFGSSISGMPAVSSSSPRSSPLALTVLALLTYQPLHPYGIQRLIKQWGKDQVVNVEHRPTLYRPTQRLLAP